MKVLLIDADRTGFPNLALMQISSFYRARGDEVGFQVRGPEEVWISCVFDWNAPTARGMALMYPEARVHLGGSGLNDDWLPGEIRKVRPDYDLYGDRYSLGFTTRGCIRSCPWCIVWRKEKKFQRWQPIEDFHDPRFRDVRLLDNNILADPEWFMEQTDFIIRHHLRVDINQGMDVRLFTPEICRRIRELRWWGPKRIAFDSLDYEDDLRAGIRMLREAGVKVRKQTVECYVLVGHESTTPEDEVARLRILKSLGVQPYVMPFTSTPWTRRLKWWARAPVFWKCDINELDRQRYRSD